MIDLCLATGKVMLLVDRENARQLKKWGVQDHEPFEWLGFATEEIGETAKAISEFIYRGGSAKNVVKEAIETATLMLKIAEMFQSLSISSQTVTLPLAEKGEGDANTVLDGLYARR